MNARRRTPHVTRTARTQRAATSVSVRRATPSMPPTPTPVSVRASHLLHSASHFICYAFSLEMIHFEYHLFQFVSLIHIAHFIYSHFVSLICIFHSNFHGLDLKSFCPIIHILISSSHISRCISSQFSSFRHIYLMLIFPHWFTFPMVWVVDFNSHFISLLHIFPHFVSFTISMLLQI